MLGSIFVDFSFVAAQVIDAMAHPLREGVAKSFSAAAVLCKAIDPHQWIVGLPVSGTADAWQPSTIITAVYHGPRKTGVPLKLIFRFFFQIAPASFNHLSSLSLRGSGGYSDQRSQNEWSNAMKALRILFAACLLGLVMVPNAGWSATRGECFNAAQSKYGPPDAGSRLVIRQAVRRCLRHGLGAI